MLNVSNFHPQYLTDEKGKKVAVVLPMEQFQELLEDIEDLAAVAERGKEGTILHEQVIKKFKND